MSRPQLCPVCRSGSIERRAQYNGYAMSRCTVCTFVFTTQREFPGRLYEDAYRTDAAYASMKHAASQTSVAADDLSKLWWSKRFALSYLERQVAGRELLDVGCGPGQFLLVARRRGWSVTGVEPTPEPARQAASYGLDVFEGWLEDYMAGTTTRFDAVTSFEVLEHVPDPTRLLATMGALLKPKGLLVLSVPNLGDPYVLGLRESASMPPVHINFFNRRSMARALDLAGLSLVRFKTLPIPTSSVRRLHGKWGLVARLPWLSLLALLGRSEGTTLVTVARQRIQADTSVRQAVAGGANGAPPAGG